MVVKPYGLLVLHGPPGSAILVDTGVLPWLVCLKIPKEKVANIAIATINTMAATMSNQPIGDGGREFPCLFPGDILLLIPLFVSPIKDVQVLRVARRCPVLPGKFGE